MSGLPAYETLRLRREGIALHVTLNRPERRNAMNLQMVDELLAVLQLAKRELVRGVVLRGEGGHFCAGGDVADMAAALGQPVGDPDPIAVMNRRFGELLLAFDRAPLALIAVVDGTAMGGGLGLACVADLVLAAPDAKFRLPETSLGLVPAQIAPFVVRRVGLRHARRLAVFGASLNAEAALAVGLCDGVHDEPNVAVTGALDSLRRCAPGALATTKELVLDVHTHELDALLDRGAADFSAAARGPEGRAGTAAFMSKTPAPWMKEPNS